MNLELKQQFVNGCNTLDGDDFIDNSIKYLKFVDCKNDLDDFVKIIVGMYGYKNISSGILLDKLCISIRDKIYDILIANGDIPENSYINLFSYLKKATMPFDERFDGYERLVDTNFYATQSSNRERIYFAILGFISAFLNSKEDALKNFLSRVLIINLDEADILDFTREIIKFLDIDGVEIESVFELLKSVLKKENYFALNKIERRSVLNWGLHCFWSAKMLFNHPLWTSLFEEWKEILYEHIARDECDEAMFVHFVMYHKLLNSWQEPWEWKQFNDKVSRVASDYYLKWASTKQLSSAKTEVSKEGKIKIGFLQDRAVLSMPT